MNESGTRVTILLQLEPEGQPIVGLVEDSCGVRRAVTGWIELIGAIEDAREGAIGVGRTGGAPGDDQ